MPDTFREMRRIKQQLSKEECIEILNKSSSGVLAVNGDSGYPYAVPLSYAYSNGKIYFHSALTGHKIDAVKNSEKVSFCVVDKDEVKPKEFTTYFKSVIVFGKAHIIENLSEKHAAIKLIADKYSPGLIAEGQKEIERTFERFCIVEINAEHITGKQAIELTAEKK